MAMSGLMTFEPSTADILALVGDGVICTDADGRILLFNRAAEEIFGYGTSEVLGEPIEILMPERLRGLHQAHVHALAQGTDPVRRVMGHRREVLGRRKAGEEFPIEATLSRQSVGGRTILTVVVRDISERKRMEEELERYTHALAASKTRLRMALEGGRMGTWRWDLRTNTISANAVLRQLWGVQTTVPLPVEEAFARVHPDDLPLLIEHRARVVDGGREFEQEFRITSSSGTLRWVAAKGTLVRDESGAPEALIGVSFDVTERQEAEEQRRLLAAELAHRIKNLIALVNSIISLSAQDNISVDAYKRSVLGRLSAVAQSHTALIEGHCRGTTLHRVLLKGLAPYRNAEDTNIAVEGPALALIAEAGMPLGLAFHELTTNAAKYGALSTPEGRVRIAWQVEAGAQGRQLVLEWREAGGPRVSRPTRRGFGSALIERTIAHQLGGTVQTEYAEAGLECRIEIPAAQILAGEPHA